MSWETVIGLEVHVELSTKTKIFCGCTTKFGGEPNTHCCPICTGMPGTLPLINKRVVEYALKAGLALKCEITRKMKFDRKNYFYPDLPKAYQISQLYLPICRNGHIDIETSLGNKRIGIHEIHMEEDAGKLTHDPWLDETLVDYNRCGVPLIEIVSEPDMRSAEEVIAYLTSLKSTLQYLGVSDCRMQEGSLRADINLSVRRAGETKLGTRTEMKNMNSFKAIARAIEGEAKRQIELIEDGRKVKQETRRWDDNKDSSFAMRSKENAQDYRYFPEPDLPPIVISDEWIKQVTESQPELPKEKRARYVSELGLPEYDAGLITQEKRLAELFEGASAVCKDCKLTSNWIMGELLSYLSEKQIPADELSLDYKKLGDILSRMQKSEINRNSAREVFKVVMETDADVGKYIAEHSLSLVGDSDMLLSAAESVINENAGAVSRYKAGEEKLFGFFVGQCMKKLRGKADPVKLGEILKEKLQ